MDAVSIALFLAGLGLPLMLPEAWWVGALLCGAAFVILVRAHAPWGRVQAPPAVEPEAEIRPRDWDTIDMLDAVLGKLERIMRDGERLPQGDTTLAGAVRELEGIRADRQSRIDPVTRALVDDAIAAYGLVVQLFGYGLRPKDGLADEAALRQVNDAWASRERLVKRLAEIRRRHGDR